MSNSWESKWKFMSELGEGGQGVTKKVINLSDPKKIGALKLLKKEKDILARNRFKREVVGLQLFKDIAYGVPKVLDDNIEFCDDIDVNLYFVMGYIDGCTLSKFIETNGVISVEKAVELTKKLLGIIKIIHSIDVVHRDIKPDNIILRDSTLNDVVLVDFGVSHIPNDSTLTYSKEQFRNSFLVLPESLSNEGDKRDKRSDLASICAILYYCLTGNKIGFLQGGNTLLVELRKKIANDNRLFELEHIIIRSLAVDINNRYQSVTDIVNALDGIISMPGQVNMNNPIEYAAYVSKEMETKDRPTLLVNYKRNTNFVYEQLQKSFNKITNKLGLFQITMVPLAHPNVKINPVADLVSLFPNSIRVQQKNHKHFALSSYRIEAIGDQCILYSLTTKVVSTNNPKKPFVSAINNNYEINEVVRINDDHSSICIMVEAFFNKWTSDSINFLKTTIFALVPKL